VARAAKLVLDPHAEDQGAAQPDKKKINAMVDHLAPGEAYWPKLESHFRTFLVNLADEFQASSTREGALAHWARTLRRAAQEAFDSCILGLELSPRTLKALARVEGWFRGALNGVLKDFEGGDQ
jgi:hypothetical protein